MQKITNNVIYGISEMKDGDMKILDNGENENNRINFFKKLNIDYGKVVSGQLVHENKVVNVGNLDAGKIFKKTDGLVSGEKNLVLAITVADCVPVFFYSKSAVGIAHAGWRGIRRGIIENMIMGFEKLGVEPDELNVAIGPRIRGCHYEVNEDVWQFFKNIPGALIDEHGATHLRLGVTILEILKNRGVKEENISVSDECTYCEEGKYFSYRRDKPEVVQAQVAFISIKN